MQKITPYNGFELGPIRPPSEAYSLLLRINRGCGWNKSVSYTHLDVYKRQAHGDHHKDHGEHHKAHEDVHAVGQQVHELPGGQGLSLIHI